MPQRANGKTDSVTGSFHDDVNDDLQKRKADVVELYQPLTPAMLDIQTAILECMELTLAEIKRSNTYVRRPLPSPQPTDRA